MYGVNGKKFQRQYKNKISEFKTWGERKHAEDWLIFPENISKELFLIRCSWLRGSVILRNIYFIGLPRE